MNTVFQDYALFPHLSVGENVEYGLKVKGVGRADRRARAADALTMVRLDGYGSRRINQLSGGQRQRVALARALVNRPKVLLLDEPLGALDLKLREEMQVELKRIQSEVGITFIYVTHDQDEALAMSDRLAVFTDGRLEQVGPPAEVYERPASAFVAGFVGTSNVITGDLARRLRGATEPFTVRPEKLRCIPADAAHDPADGEIRATGTIRTAVYLGERTRYRSISTAAASWWPSSRTDPTATPGPSPPPGPPCGWRGTAGSTRCSRDRRRPRTRPRDRPIDAVPTNAAPHEGEA